MASSSNNAAKDEVLGVFQQAQSGGIPSNDPTYEVVWPSSLLAMERQARAPRLESFAEVTIAFVWDYMFRGEELFPAIAKELGTRYPGIGIVGWSEFGNIHGPDEAKVLNDLPRKLKQHGVDAVICAVGC